MNKYKLSGKGRTLGAIGIFHWIEVEVQAENEEQAQLESYKQVQDCWITPKIEAIK